MKKHLLTIAILTLSPLIFVHAGSNQPHESRRMQPAGQIAAKAKAPLGDLGPYRTILADTLAIVKTGKLKAAEKRITDLETAWDVSANKLKALNPKPWGRLDLALDTVLFELRADKPDAKLCTKALQDMLDMIDSMK